MFHFSLKKYRFFSSKKRAKCIPRFFNCYSNLPVSPGDDETDAVNLQGGREKNRRTLTSNLGSRLA